MSDLKKDPYLERLSVIQAEVDGIDMRLSALEQGYALDAEEVDKYIKANAADYNVTFEHFLSKQEINEINKRYNKALNQGVDCDTWDYGLAAMCGAFSGILDVLFASDPHNGILSKATDDIFDDAVKKFAKMSGWKPDSDKKNNIASAIGWLEGHYKVGYDQAKSSDVDNVIRHLSPKNHHAKSLAHYPDIIGLIASLCDQFNGTSTFLDSGTGVIKIVPATDNGWELRGDNMVSKLFCGTINWLGHCISDIAGSSGSRGQGDGHIGAGLPAPFTEFLQLCDFGKLKNDKGQFQTFATVMTEVYEQGYDVRHMTTTAVPVIINELLIRAIYTVRRHFYFGRSWEESKPVGNDPELQRMLTVGIGVLCITDLAHAALTSCHSWVIFFSKLNIVAWARLGLQGTTELKLIANREMNNIQSIQDDISSEWERLLVCSRELCN